ncbi:hypothetical protein HDV05_007463 [Chytridiales sp. JEL 0842]|nr:hypothetical protein HDV05_007463 [Chytridiales sp. JEL 0842]
MAEVAANPAPVSTQPAAPEDNNYLTVTDPLTNTSIKIPISPLNYIPASAFTQLRIKPTTPPSDVPGDTVPVRLYDPGFKNTVVCRSKISMVVKEGGLYYRGYDVNELVEKSTFLDVAYLLIYGDLPNKKDYNNWCKAVMSHTYIHTELEKQMLTFRYDAHPMGMLISTIASLSTFHPQANPALQGDSLYMKPKIPKDRAPTPEEVAKLKSVEYARNNAIFRMLGKTPTMAANAYRHRIGRPYNYPMPGSLNYAENFLYMLDKLNEPNYVPDPRLVRILDKIFILLAEHGSNCSTVTMRHLASSGVDPYTALSGAAGALFGERKASAVIGMLKQIGKVENIQVFLTMIKRKQAVSSTSLSLSGATGSQSGLAKKAKPMRLMGFGHRIYKTADPRVKICKDLALELFSLMGKGDLGELALALEEAALSDDWFTQRRLYPNIDYWCAIVFHTLGFPADMFPVLMCVPRTAGFCAHWIESLDDPEYKIYRPRQIYMGENKRNFEQPEAVNAPPALTASYVRGDPQAAMRRVTAEMTLSEINELIEKAQKAVEELSVQDGPEDATSSPGSSGAGGVVDPSRFEIGPVSSWVVKKLFPSGGAGSGASSESTIRSARLASTQAELQELLRKQGELLIKQQKELQRLHEEQSAAELLKQQQQQQAQKVTPSSPGSMSNLSVSSKPEPDLMAGSKSPRVFSGKRI